MLKEKIQNEIKKAIKEGNELTVSTLRMLSASIISKEKEKRYKISKQKPDLDEKGLEKESWLTDEEALEIIGSEIKKRKDSIAAYRQGEREELAKKEEKEIVILQKYLPEQLSDQELKKIIQEAIVKIGGPKGHPEIKDMGKVMAELMPKVKGRADGGLVSKLVKDLLSAK